jgi:hypothetical protein
MVKMESLADSLSERATRQMSKQSQANIQMSKHTGHKTYDSFQAKKRRHSHPGLS